MKNNVIDIISFIDDWRLINEIHLSAKNENIQIFGNYRKNVHQIRIVSETNDIKLEALELAQLQNAINKYNER